MSNNAPDYEDNLVFPPQEIKSQDDIKHQDTRSSDVLIKAVEKCVKLEKQLKIAIEALSKYADIHNWDFIDGDDDVKGCSFWDMSENGCEEACVALSKIKELNNGKNIYFNKNPPNFFI